MKLLFLFCLFPLLVYPACTISESTFPSYLGGSSADTILNVLDINPTTGYLAVAGYTSDPEVLSGVSGGTPGAFNPLIMLIDRPNVVQWKVYFSDLSEQITLLRFSPDGSLLVAVLENQPLRIFLFNSIDGSKVGSLEQQTPASVRAARFCQGNCLQFSALTNTMYLAMQASYADTVESDPSFCCFDDGTFSATCCDYRLWELMKLDYSTSSGLVLNIDQDFVYDRESTANMLRVFADTATSEQVYVAGYTTRAGTATPREHRPTISQHRGSDLHYYWSLQSNQGSLANYYQMIDMYLYKDSPNTLIAACSHDKLASGVLGLHLFKQTTATGVPS